MFLNKCNQDGGTWGTHVGGLSHQKLRKIGRKTWRMEQLLEISLKILSILWTIVYQNGSLVCLKCTGKRPEHIKPKNPEKCLRILEDSPDENLRHDLKKFESK